VRGDEGRPGHIGAHAAIAQDEVGQDGEYSFTRGALDTPDGTSAQAETDIMRVARQAATLAATGFVGELQAEGQEEGEAECNKRFGGAQERHVGRLIAEVDGDRAVVTYRFGSVSHVSSPGQRPLARMRHGEGHVWKDQASCERLGSSPLNTVECGTDSSCRVLCQDTELCPYFHESLYGAIELLLGVGRAHLRAYTGLTFGDNRGREAYHINAFPE